MRTIIPRVRAHRLPGRPSALDNVARRAVLARLAKLTVGRLEVVEPRARAVFGEARPEDAGLDVRVEVHSPELWRRVLVGGSTGLADAWTEGLLHTENLSGLLRLFTRNLAVSDDFGRGVAKLIAPLARCAHALRRNTRRGSRENIRAHYDLDGELFELFLDETRSYSSGIFPDENSTLLQASHAKLDRLFDKLGLEPQHHLLEIGTGWGGLAIRAARERGCRVTTTTISREQYAYARDWVAREGLQDRIDVRLEDYRDLRGRFDRVVSVEMIEAVGHEYLGEYFSRVADLLTPAGLAVIQAITMPDHRYERYRRTVDFIRARIFPGSCVPSVSAMLSAAARSSDLRPLHLEDIGPHYARTLREWRRRFEARRDRVLAFGYPESFARLWSFYLAYCEAGFEERYLGNVHLLFARPAWRGEAPLGTI